MKCPVCGQFYLPSDTVCPQCGATLAPVAGETLYNKPAALHHYFLSSGGYLWEYRELRIPLDLTFTPPAVSQEAHQQFVNAFDHSVRTALEEAAADGWQTDEPVTWEDLRTTGKIDIGWGDQVKDIFGI